MQVVNLDEKNYAVWDEFCSASDDAWFWHTSAWLRYNLNYKPEKKPESKSFFVKNDNKIVAICPLILEDNDGAKEFSFGGGFCPAPALFNDLSGRSRDKVIKFIFEEVDKLAKVNGVKRARFKSSVLNKSFIEKRGQNFNYLMKYGYLDVSINTQVIDLNKTLVELKGDLRHGHDYDVDRASKKLTAEIFNEDNITEEVFDKYVDLHHKASGRVTRPRSTFDVMCELIKRGQAFLVGAKDGAGYFGFSYFFLYKNNIYYGSSCNEPDAKGMPVAHFIQWSAIEYMKRKKYGFYEIGWQNYGNTLSDFPSPKEIDIARFKRGFGGFTVPLFMGEKYYDKEYFTKIYENRIKKFASSMDHS